FIQENDLDTQSRFFVYFDDDGNNEIDYDEFRTAMDSIVASLKQHEDQYELPP
ncbi:hypothetical protein KIPB_011650, partial [Kipferlia bialata]